MRPSIAFGRIALSSIAAAAFAFACSNDNNSNPSTDGGLDGSTMETGGKTGTGGTGSGGKTSTGGAGGSTAGKTGSGGSTSSEAGVPDGGDGGPGEVSLCGGKSGQAQIDCGQYIVEAIAACADCHTPRLPSGAPDTTKILAGNPSFADIDGTKGNGMGNVPAPNLTQLKADGWTAAEIKDAILNGQRSAAHGGGMFPAMPYFTLHNMASADADAVVAFIMNLTPITNDVGTREPLPGIPAGALPIPPVKVSDIPAPVLAKTDPSYNEALLGQYLATKVGPCLECHTERDMGGNLEMTKAFGGGEQFVVGGPFGTVVSANITPDPKTGIAWTAGAVKTLLKTGVNVDGEHICPPMPVGPMGAFGKLTDDHALAIGAYITHLPAVTNGLADGGVFPMCVLPPAPKDAGKP